MNIRKTIPWKVCKWIYYKFRINFIFQRIHYIMHRHFARYDIIAEEHLKHFGRDFPEKTFYVVRSFKPAGLLNDFHCVVDHTYYAISKGYIPVVNWESYLSWHTEKTPIEVGGSITLNSWEYFFEQPCGYSLKDIKKAKNVILGDAVKHNNYFKDNIVSRAFPLKDKNAISKYNEFVSKYLRLNLNTRECLNKYKQLLFDNKNNVLGVSYRVAGYKNTDGTGVKDHNIGPSIEEMIEKVSEIFYKEKFNYIFISTDEQEIVDEIYKVLPEDKIINPTRKRFKTNNQKNYIEEYILLYMKKESIFEYELNYLTEVCLLSECDGIVASCFSHGVLFALGHNNNKYRHKYIFELGTY